VTTLADPGALDRAARGRLLAGAPIAADLRGEVRAAVEAFRGRHGYTPALAALVLGRSEPFARYLQQILRACGSVGLEGREVHVEGRVSAARVRAALGRLNADPHVAGIIVQQPLPRGLSPRVVAETLDPAKDVDGLTPLNTGLVTLGYGGYAPATAEAAVEILRRSGVSLEGLHAVIVGRSHVVGRPVAQLLLREHCTVTICHRRTRDLGSHTRQADVLVVAAGAPGLVTGEMLKPGAIVVDVGTSVIDGRIVGDVEPESAARVAAALTPVPGGVGPVTNAVLMQHVIRAAEVQAHASRRAATP
jgi:methylenetetrahydrofolate dehydrogenase (NADP+)/methenyltetrahydrofolate cyclohydrolase